MFLNPGGLADRGRSRHPVHVTSPDLKALRGGDVDAWDQAFRWPWPTAFAVAQLKLEPFLPGGLEDVHLVFTAWVFQRGH